VNAWTRTATVDCHTVGEAAGRKRRSPCFRQRAAARVDAKDGNIVGARIGHKGELNAPGASASYTKLNTRGDVAVDAAGNIYVADGDPSYATVYAAGATGDVAPVRTIQGRRTKLTGTFIGLTYD
jgi:hypothetical protein